MTSPQFSLSRVTRLLIVALEALFIVGMVASGVGGQRFMVMERPEARVYRTLTMAGGMSFVLLIVLELLALFSPSLRRFALFGLCRLLIYLICIFGVSLLSPIP